ncbi:MAG: iron transporter [Peptococcaceae bacterium BICA1-7]|nr:MAG: iron transporter [Peptococcaceae bacterium BICA1-7]HBV99020.1 ferrous iron transport protein A [Desulfotomaculum sp.]
MTLDSSKRGQVIRIISLPDEMIRAQATRFGIPEGTVVTCREVIPMGPVVIGRNRQEIAIGRNLAKLIGVEPVWSGEKECAAADHR